MIGPAIPKIGPNNAGRKPPCCNIFFFFSILVLGCTNERRPCLWRVSLRFWPRFNVTLPFKTLRAHSQRQYTKSLLAFCINTLFTFGLALDMTLSMSECFFKWFAMVMNYEMRRLCDNRSIYLGMYTVCCDFKTSVRRRRLSGVSCFKSTNK